MTNSFSVSKPGSISSTASKLRTNSAAPDSTMIDSATWMAMSTSRSAPEPSPWPEPERDWRGGVFDRVRGEDWEGGGRVEKKAGPGGAGGGEAGTRGAGPGGRGAGGKGGG